RLGGHSSDEGSNPSPSVCRARFGFLRPAGAGIQVLASVHVEYCRRPQEPRSAWRTAWCHAQEAGLMCSKMGLDVAQGGTRRSFDRGLTILDVTGRRFPGGRLRGWVAQGRLLASVVGDGTIDVPH